MSFDWNQVRAFLATAEEGSFSAAARALETTQPTVGRQIAALEGALGVTLFERSARGLALTRTGRDLLDHVRAMGEAATLVSMTAFGRAQDMTGEVTVTATDLLSAAFLPRLLQPLRRTAPGLRLRVNAVNDIQNLLRREADIAIRHVRPEQPELIARHVANFRANLYAASAYLDRAGRPRTPREAAGHAFVGNPDPVRLLPFLRQRGIDVPAERFAVSSDSGVVVWELTKAGYGLSMQPEILGDAEPRVERALPDFPALEFPIWLVTHRELRTNPRIRLVFDSLAQGLAEATGAPAGAPGGATAPSAL